MRRMHRLRSRSGRNTCQRIPSEFDTCSLTPIRWVALVPIIVQGGVVIVKFHSNGTLDTAYGSGGKVALAFERVPEWRVSGHCPEEEPS